MLESFLKTSTHAEMEVRLDHDDAPQYAPVRAEFNTRIHFVVGDRIAHCPALNEMCRRNPRRTAYGLATDDSLFLTPGWDDWALKTAESFPNGVGAFAPFFGLKGRMDYPWVSRGWTEALGVYIPNDSKLYYWDIVMQILAEQAGCFALAEEREFAMFHRSVAGTEHDTDMEKALRVKSMAAFIDARNTCYWLQDGRREALEKPRAAIVGTVGKP
jgi:hypothetical protein